MDDTSNHKRRWISVGLALTWLVGLVALSFLSAHEKATLHTQGHYHYLGHFLSFFLLMYLLVRVAQSRRSLVAEHAGAIALACTIEIAQKYINHTDLEWADILLDVCGIFAATALLKVVREFRR